MERILVSACLVGAPVRFDGGAKTHEGEIFARWKREGRLVPVCPEVEGGLGIPRPPAEIDRGTALDVLDGTGRVVAKTGADVTSQFLAGAQRALELAQSQGIRLAVLKARSPSCGSTRVYDGTFTGTLVEGEGVTTALLRAHGLAVFSEDELDAADARLRELENGGF